MRYNTVGLGLLICVGALVLALAPSLGASGLVQAGADPDLGMGRSLNLEEAWLENAAYLTASLPMGRAAGDLWSLGAETDFAIDGRIGGELDVPSVLMRQPAGSAASALGPVALGLRVVACSFGDASSPSAGIVSFEAEGASAIAPQSFRLRTFPGLGSSITGEALGGYRIGSVFLQGEYGRSVAAGPDAAAGVFANSSLGWHWFNLRPQVEADFAGGLGAGWGTWSLVPELGWDLGDWFLEVGEGRAVWGGASGASQTQLLVEREL